MSAPSQQDMEAVFDRYFEDYRKPTGNFLIKGNDSQTLHFVLDRDEHVLSEAGAMKYFTPGIQPDAKMGQIGACICGGQSFFRVTWTNTGEDGALMGLAPPFNASIIPVSLEQYPGLVIKEGAFLAATDVDLQIETRMVKSLGAMCAGHGVLIHPLQGNGTVFLNALGNVMFHTLEEGEVLCLSTGSVVAFQASCEFTVEKVKGGVKMCCCGGEGFFNTKLVGPGLVILQSLSFEELRSALNVKHEMGEKAFQEKGQDIATQLCMGMIKNALRNR